MPSENRDCKTVGCFEPSIDGRGLCAAHLTKFLLDKGRPKRARSRKKIHPRVRAGHGLEWLRAHVSYQGDECLIFPFGNDPGKAQVTLYGRPTKASRAMCRLVHGLPPEGKEWALHTCGNGHLGCVHPDHLYWGDASDNAKDARQHTKEGKRPVIRKIRTYTSEQATKTRRILIAEHNERHMREGYRD